MITLKGIPASPGAASGRSFVLFRATLDVPEKKITGSTPDAEIAAFNHALSMAAGDVKRMIESSNARQEKDEADIFGAHLLMLEDPALVDGVAGRIRGQGLDAESACAAVVREIAAQFEAMEDEYFRARVADVRDIGLRVLKYLVKNAPGSRSASEPGILITEELLPSDVADIDNEKVLGIATQRGGAASHASILARNLGIPCVVGIEGLLAAVNDGDVIAVDGESGVVVVAPDELLKRRMRKLSDELKARKSLAWGRRSEPAISLDGKHIAVMANAGSVEDVREAVSNGAEGVGLFRTEFLFLDRRSLPSEDEQAAVYTEAARAAGGLPVSIRLLDIGGDKPAEYLKIPEEQNPFLGLRSIRLLLRNPEVLQSQIRAILRSAAHGNVSILVPMVSNLDEIDGVKEMIKSCRKALATDGFEIPPVQLGAMIETPAAALGAKKLAGAVDYFSIGTNDLTQYCMAADRGNPGVAYLYNPTHLAVQMLIRIAASAARDAGIKIGVCGETASDEKAVPTLLALGVDSLSAAPSMVPDIKEVVRNTNVAETDVEV